MAGLIRNQEIRCIKCGYDLRASASLRCPECGHEHTPEELDAGRRFTAETDRYLLRCIFVVPIAVACLYAIVVVLPGNVRSNAPDMFGPVIGALILASLVTTSILAARRTAQHDLVGRPEPPARRVKPVRWVITIIAITIAMLLNQLLLASVFATIAAGAGTLLIRFWTGP